MVLQFISGVFIVFSTLPKPIQEIGAVFPVKWLCQGMRSVFLPDAFQRQELAGSWELGRTALVLALWSLAALVLALRYFRFRRRGDT
jgi:ABC-2 type transport system permease protein